MLSFILIVNNLHARKTLLIASVNTCVCSNLYCPWSCSFVSFDKWMLIFHKTEFLQRIFRQFFLTKSSKSCINTSQWVSTYWKVHNFERCLHRTQLPSIIFKKHSKFIHSWPVISFKILHSLCSNRIMEVLWCAATKLFTNSYQPMTKTTRKKFI